MQILERMTDSEKIMHQLNQRGSSSEIFIQIG